MSRSQKIGIAVGCTFVLLSILGIVYEFLGTATSECGAPNSCTLNVNLLISYFAILIIGIWLARTSLPTAEREKQNFFLQPKVDKNKNQGEQPRT